jgi:putative transposase
VVSPAVRRERVVRLKESGCSERRACRLVGLSRGSCSRTLAANDDLEVVERIQSIIKRRPRFGYPRVHLELRRQGMVINHKRTARLYRLHHLQLAQRRPVRKRSKTRSLTASLGGINQRWSMDFVHDRLTCGKPVRTLTVIDEYSRECLALETDFSLSSHRVVRVLERLRFERGLPVEIGIDQGPEFTSKVLHKWAQDQRVNLHFASPGNKNENAFIESFNGRLRDECLNMNEFQTIISMRDILDEWRYDYNHFRLHTSLKGKTPLEFVQKNELTKCA